MSASLHGPAVQHPTRYLKLPLSFDRQRLAADLAAIRDSEWLPHFNTAAYEGGWSCVPLRSIGGRSDHIVSVDGEYRDTEILHRCPYFRVVIDSFACEKTSVRLMALDAGATIREHVDPATSCEEGIARLHVPIQTTPEVVFIVEGEEVHFSAGDTWYLNAGLRHGVRNASPFRRVHLMLDLRVNPWLRQILDAAGLQEAPPAKYDDPSINDDNVDAVIAALRAMGEASAPLADRLIALRNGG